MARSNSFFGRWVAAPLAILIWILAGNLNENWLPSRFERQEFSGFPLLDRSSPPEIYLTSYIYVAPLVVNLVVYGLIAGLGVWTWRAIPLLRGRVLNGVLGASIWVASAACLLLYVIAVAAGMLDLVWWYHPETWEALHSGN
jgi:hypothetical protein